MEGIAENQLFEHNLGVSVCAQPVRPVQQTGQTGLHGSAWPRRDQPVRPVAKTGQTGPSRIKLLSPNCALTLLNQNINCNFEKS